MKANPKKSRSKSKTKDENEKRPLNAYMLFMKEYRAQKKDVKVSAKEIGEKWKQLTNTKKKKYEEIYQKKKAE